jgi:cation diffusion facilitator CzcD-associated flavoprotein CzcO
MDDDQLQAKRDELRRKYRDERAKRLREDGNDQFRQVVGELAKYVDDPHVTPGFTRDALDIDVEVLLIGGGFGSLVLASELLKVGIDDIRIIDKAGDFGGTWYWNRYPGVMCDVEAYIYLPLLEETGFIPSHKYAAGSEIFGHAQRIGRQLGLYENAVFQTGVTSMVWDEKAASWLVRTDRDDVIRARYVSTASGPLNKPKLPAIPGIEDFAGESFHTSRWDYSYTGGDERGGLTGLADKRVGVIGTGATAIQCIPHIAESARQLYVFQRTPNAVDVRANRPTDPAWAASLEPGWQEQRMLNFETIIVGGDTDIDLVDDGWTRTFTKISGIATKKAARELGRMLTPEERFEVLETADFKTMETIRARVAAVVEDPQTAESLKPWYRRFCKRPAFHDEYLQSFNRDNVTLVDTSGRGPDRITATSVVVDGVSYDVDCLIFATGFEVGTNFTRRASYEVIGRDGVSLSDKWENGFQTFHGLYTHKFPNCFFLGTTQTGVTINYTKAIVEQSRHLAYVLAAARARGATVIEPSETAEKEWVEEILTLARRGVEYYAECTPGFLTNEGKPNDPRGLLSGSYGGGPLKFFDLLAEWREVGELSGLDLR